MSRETQLILASGSPYRRELLERLGLPFRVQPADIDESPAPGETPESLVQRLAEGKARAVHPAPGAVVIGSDQVAVLDDSVLGKPGNRENAVEQLRRQSGRTVRFLTAICVLADGRAESTVVEVGVRFRELSDDEIRRYLDRDEPLDCAGSFKSESLGVALCEAVECNDPTALVGLPLIRLCQLLRRAGVSVP